MTQLRKSNKLVIVYNNGRRYTLHRVEDVVVNGNFSLNFVANKKQAVLRLGNIQQINFYPEGSAPSHHFQLQNGKVLFERKSFCGDSCTNTGVEVLDNTQDLRRSFKRPVVNKISDIL